MVNCVKAGAAISALAISGSAYAVAIPITNTPAPTNAGLLAGLVPLDITGLGISGLSGVNSFVSPFSNLLIAGSLTSTVYGNVGAPGLSLNTVLIKYRFENTGIDSLDAFEIGLNSSLNLDKNDYVSATHGEVEDVSSALQGVPSVLYNDNALAFTNDSLLWDYQGGFDQLAAGEVYEWYVMQDGAVKIGLVPGTVTNFGNANIEALAFVTDPGQPDLDTPTPGAAALLGIAGLASLRRRRS